MGCGRRRRYRLSKCETKLLGSDAVSFGKHCTLNFQPAELHISEVGVVRENADIACRIFHGSFSYVTGLSGNDQGILTMNLRVPKYQLGEVGVVGENTDVACRKHSWKGVEDATVRSFWEMSKRSHLELAYSPGSGGRGWGLWRRR